MARREIRLEGRQATFYGRAEGSFGLPVTRRSSSGVGVQTFVVTAAWATAPGLAQQLALAGAQPLVTLLRFGAQRAGKAQEGQCFELFTDVFQ